MNSKASFLNFVFLDALVMNYETSIHKYPRFCGFLYNFEALVGKYEAFGQTFKYSFGGFGRCVTHFKAFVTVSKISTTCDLFLAKKEESFRDLTGLNIIKGKG